MVLVAPMEAFANDSRPLLALREALRNGEICRALRGQIREHVPGTRPSVR